MCLCAFDSIKRSRWLDRSGRSLPFPRRRSSCARQGMCLGLICMFDASRPLNRTFQLHIHRRAEVYSVSLVTSRASENSISIPTRLLQYYCRCEHPYSVHHAHAYLTLHNHTRAYEISNCIVLDMCKTCMGTKSLPNTQRMCRWLLPPAPTNSQRMLIIPSPHLPRSLSPNISHDGMLPFAVDALTPTIRLGASQLYRRTHSQCAP